MKRKLTVIEGNDNASLWFSIYASNPTEADMFGEKGYIRTVDPEAPDTASYVRRLGYYDSNQEAKRAAELYASQRGLVMEEWTISHPERPTEGEPNIKANAAPPRRG
jgi:hypothetical protein